MGLNILDVWSTLILLNEYGAREANPIANWLITHHLLTATKLLVVAAIGICCLKTKHRKRVTIMLWSVVVLYGFVVIHNMNYLI